jgi:hypothetical protein
MPKLQEIKFKKKDKTHSTFSVTIPSAIVKLKKMEKGDNIEFIEENGKIILEVKK